jgi:hypothetical protein
MNLDKSKYKWLGRRATRELKPGVAHLAIRGTDFECEPASFAGQVYQAAYALDLKASCAVFSDRVVFAFYRGDDFVRPNLPAYPVVRKMRGES